MPRAFPRKIVDHVSRLDREQLEHFFVRAMRDGQLLRRMLDTMVEGVIASNRSRVVLFANASIYDLIGVTGEQAVGQPLGECLRDPALRQAVELADVNVYVSTEVSVNYPRRLQLIAQIVPLAPDADDPDDDADSPAFILLLRNVSEERLLSNVKERESRLETLRLLTAGVAHEIGNPLGAIILHTQLMERTLQKMRASRNISEITRINLVVQEESLRLKRIVGDFLNAVRPLQVRLVRGSPADLLRETFELLGAELNDRKVTIVKRIDAIPDTLFDADQLRGAIINIVRNAMDAMPGGGTLAVSVAARGDMIELSFRDNGCGIPKDRIAHLFTPFYTTKPHGSGLGLLIVQRILHAHGGSVRIQSSEGKGTDVTLDLPVRQTTGRKYLPSPQRKPPR